MGILQYGLAVPEIWHESKVEIFVDGSFEESPDAPKNESTCPKPLGVIGKESAVGLGITTYL